MSHLANDWLRSYFHQWKQELETKERWVLLVPLETDELWTDVLCAPGTCLFVTSQQQKMNRKGLKGLGRRRQCRRTVWTWWLVQLTQTSRGLLECNSGKPGTFIQNFLSLEGGGARLLPPTNFILDENAHPDPERKQVKQRAGSYSDTAEEASSVLERQALLPNCHYGDTIRFPLQRGDDCTQGSMEQKDDLWLLNQDQVKTKHSIFKVYLKTVIMSSIYTQRLKIAKTC